jgi:hypothetical protein
MSVLRAVSDIVGAPMRAVVRRLVAPTAEERKREADPPIQTPAERTEAARKHVDTHLAERQSRREDQGSGARREASEPE